MGYLNPNNHQSGPLLLNISHIQSRIFCYLFFSNSETYIYLTHQPLRRAFDFFETSLCLELSNCHSISLSRCKESVSTPDLPRYSVEQQGLRDFNASLLLSLSVSYHPSTIHQALYTSLSLTTTSYSYTSCCSIFYQPKPPSSLTQQTFHSHTSPSLCPLLDPIDCIPFLPTTSSNH